MAALSRPKEKKALTVSSGAIGDDFRPQWLWGSQREIRPQGLSAVAQAMLGHSHYHATEDWARLKNRKGKAKLVRPRSRFGTTA